MSIAAVGNIGGYNHGMSGMGGMGGAGMGAMHTNQLAGAMSGDAMTGSASQTQAFTTASTFTQGGVDDTFKNLIAFALISALLDQDKDDNEGDNPLAMLMLFAMAMQPGQSSSQHSMGTYSAQHVEGGQAAVHNPAPASGGGMLNVVA